ncbi:MAG: hypothetical protein CVU12_00925 [Bacteroidetes bacterium HGW-Bacteroidetes-7]|jgi:DNA uptake protein ComE-like DNA-binding protein|nr:MAG: hypothetical protein CVU12_00925 [Bacteroidetes bacterium HGW-Bacteroidetes-7]
MKKRIASKELSGVLVLIVTILFLQTVIFLFRPAGNSDSSGKSLATQNQEQSGNVRSSQFKTTQNRSVSHNIGSGLSNDSKPSYETSTYNRSTHNNSAQNNSTDNKLNSLEKNSKSSMQPSANGAVAELFLFDPNTVSLVELTRLGMTEKQANVVINYRSKGGVFRDKEDFRKIYSVSDQLYSKVQDYIIIKQSAENIKHSGNNSKQSGKEFNQSEANFASAGIYQNVGRQWKEEEFLLELNGADSADLTKLKGIGPYYASKILRYRERLGGFVHPGQLTEITGIDSVRFMMFAGNIFVDTTKVEKRDLTTATYSQLASNPYIGSYMARSIIRYIERNQGQKISITELLVKNIIKNELYNILRIYFR